LRSGRVAPAWLCPTAVESQSSSSLPRQALKAFKSDFAASANLLSYQLAKETFNLRHPLGSRGGRGDSLRLVGTRISHTRPGPCYHPTVVRASPTIFR
jgi:hypothetical protein